jgi:hypothetical protein
MQRRRIVTSVQISDYVPTHNMPLLMTGCVSNGNWFGQFTNLNNSTNNQGGSFPGVNPITVTLFPIAGTINMLTVTGDVPTTTPGETFTLYQNGSATAMQVTVPNGSTTGSTVLHQINVAANDLISIYWDPASAGTFGAAAYAIVFTPL